MCNIKCGYREVRVYGVCVTYVGSEGVRGDMKERMVYRHGAEDRQPSSVSLGCTVYVRLPLCDTTRS